MARPADPQTVTGDRFKTTHMESNLRPGGKWLMHGIGIGGRPFTVQGVYREIQQPEVPRSCSRCDSLAARHSTLCRLSGTRARNTLLPHCIVTS
jgi:hypothetical protein